MGALHVGPRPTFPGAEPTIEVHMLDFDQELYGREIRLDLIALLREVVGFGTVDALRDQMQEDVDRARTVLESRSSERANLYTLSR